MEKWQVVQISDQKLHQDIGSYTKRLWICYNKDDAIVSTNPHNTNEIGNV